VSAKIADGKLDSCPVIDGEHTCSTEDQARPYRTARTVSTIGFWTGAVLAAGGVTALLLGGREPESAARRVTWGVGPGAVTLRGVF